MRQDDYSWLKSLGSVGSVGILIGVSTTIGMLFGLWLDRKLGAAPWLAFVFTLLGLAAGLYEAVRIILKANQ